MKRLVTGSDSIDDELSETAKAYIRSAVLYAIETNYGDLDIDAFATIPAGDLEEHQLITELTAETVHAIREFVMTNLLIRR